MVDLNNNSRPASYIEILCLYQISIQSSIAHKVSLNLLGKLLDRGKNNQIEFPSRS